MLYRQTFTTRLSIAIVNDQAGGASSTAGLEANLRQALGFGKKDLIEINEGDVYKRQIPTCEILITFFTLPSKPSITSS